MTATYDKYYQTENLFGDPYPELIEFFANYPKKGKVLDLGCGQGRDAIAIAQLGYSFQPFPSFRSAKVLETNWCCRQGNQ